MADYVAMLREVGCCPAHVRECMELADLLSGFTDEDRALLYLLAEVLPMRGNIAEEHVARLWAIAGKVAALLPPETT